MYNPQEASATLPTPSTWAILGDIAGRQIVRGILTINSISNETVQGTINFRGTPLPITGTWNQSTQQIQFDTPYATFSGQLSIFDESATTVRHFMFQGRFIMKPPSLQAGEAGTWLAITDTVRTGPPTYTDATPPAAAFTLSNMLYGDYSTRR